MPSSFFMVGMLGDNSAKYRNVWERKEHVGNVKKKLQGKYNILTLIKICFFQAEIQYLLIWSF